jgi:hypothetical protein
MANFGCIEGVKYSVYISRELKVHCPISILFFQVTAFEVLSR